MFSVVSEPQYWLGKKTWMESYFKNKIFNLISPNPVSEVGSVLRNSSFLLASVTWMPPHWGWSIIVSEETLQATKWKKNHQYSCPSVEAGIQERDVTVTFVSWGKSRVVELDLNMLNGRYFMSQTVNLACCQCLRLW